jgi:hypothetical protein
MVHAVKILAPQNHMGTYIPYSCALLSHGAGVLASNLFRSICITRASLLSISRSMRSCFAAMYMNLDDPSLADWLMHGKAVKKPQLVETATAHGDCPE